MGDKQRKLKDKASRLYSDGKLRDALKLYEQVVFEDSTELQCQLKIGDIYRKIGNADAAVSAYEPVAEAYAEDGLLLKAIAVCKMILQVDPRHTDTQEMLANLYSKRRAPPRALTPAMPTTGPAPIELPELSGDMEVQRTASEEAAGKQEPRIIQGKKEESAELEAPQWPPREGASTTVPWPQSAKSNPQMHEGTAQPPSIPWPQATTPTSDTPNTPPTIPWPQAGASAPEPGGTIEDSVLDITVGEVMTESQAMQPAVDAEQDTSAAIQSLLSEMSDEHLAPGAPGSEAVEALEDEPLGFADEAQTVEEPVIELTKPKGPPGGAMNIPLEQTWSGVIKIEDLDKITEESVGETVAVDDAPSEVREAPPIELTQPARDPTADIADEIDRPQIPLFSDLPKSAFIELLIQMEMREMFPGEYVIKEGEVGDSFFVIATGRVRIVRTGESGEEVILAYLQDGAFFGEMALLQDGARTASVVVEEESQIFEISKTVLDNVVSSFPSVAHVLKNFYKQRLLSTAMATNAVFKPFDADQRRDLMEMFKSKNFDKGAQILKQGKKGSGLFLLLHGKLRVVKTKEDDSEVTLAELGPGDMFGEMSLLTNQPTSATVEAVTDCFVVRLSKRKFDEVIMTHPQILELVAQVSDERRSVNDMILSEQPMIEGAILV